MTLLPLHADIPPVVPVSEVRRERQEVCELAGTTSIAAPNLIVGQGGAFKASDKCQRVQLCPQAWRRLAGDG